MEALTGMPDQKRNQPIQRWIAALAGAATGAFILNKILQRRYRIDYAGKAVLITGGSRGLGLVLARQLAEQGARLALVARDAVELDSAVSEIHQMGAEVIGIPADLRDEEEAASAVRQAADRYGGLDVLINNAGIVQVGPLQQMDLGDFEDAMQTHFWGPLYTMLAAIPVMKAQGGGRIINISSIGGEVAVPHLAPYVASKFALTGLSQSFQVELARDHILVSTVHPGLMRTGSPVNALFKGQHAKEQTWFTMMDALPPLSMSAERAARQILQSGRYATPYRTLSIPARLLSLANRIMPNLTSAGMKLFNQLLPRPGGSQGRVPRKGSESPSRLSPSPLTALSDRASARNNELQSQPEVVTEEVDTEDVSYEP